MLAEGYKSCLAEQDVIVEGYKNWRRSQEDVELTEDVRLLPVRQVQPRLGELPGVLQSRHANGRFSFSRQESCHNTVDLWRQDKLPPSSSAIHICNSRYSGVFSTFLEFNNNYVTLLRLLILRNQGQINQYIRVDRSQSQ